MRRSTKARPRARCLSINATSGGVRYQDSARQKIEYGLPDAQHPHVRAAHDGGCGHDHHGKAIGKSKWKRRDARAERRKDRIVVARAEDYTGPRQPAHTYRQAPRRSESR